MEIATLHGEDSKEINLDLQLEIKDTQSECQKITLNVQIRKCDNVDHISKLFFRREIRRILRCDND